MKISSFCPGLERTARFAASVLVCACLVAGSTGCDEIRKLFDAPPEEPPIPPMASGSASAMPPLRLPADAGPPPPVPMDPKLRRSLKLPPRRASTSLIAFGKGRIAVLTEDALLVRSTTAFAETLKFPLERPRGVLGLTDGSFVGVGARNTLRILPQDAKPKLLAHLPLLPDSSLLADRVNPDRFWSLPRSGGTLFAFEAVPGVSPLLAPAVSVDLDGFDRRALGSLRDGSFLYTSGTAFRQFYGTGKRVPVLGESRDVWRILPGSRPDNAWVFTGNKATLYMVLAGKLEKQRTLELETTPFDAESSGNYLAVLELAQPDDAPWGFVLEVFDGTGKRRLRAALDALETFDDDWARRLSENRAVAVQAEPPMVAVGGATHLEVWTADKGTHVFSGQ